MWSVDKVTETKLYILEFASAIMETRKSLRTGRYIVLNGIHISIKSVIDLLMSSFLLL